MAFLSHVSCEENSNGVNSVYLQKVSVHPVFVDNVVQCPAVTKHQRQLSLNCWSYTLQRQLCCGSLWGQRIPPCPSWWRHSVSSSNHGKVERDPEAPQVFRSAQVISELMLHVSLTVHKTNTCNYTRQAVCSLTKAFIFFQVRSDHSTEVHVVHKHQLPLFLLQAQTVTLLGWHAHDVFDHISDTIEYIVIVILGFPHEGRSADHLVLLVHISFVKESVKAKAGVTSERKNDKMTINLQV